MSSDETAQSARLMKVMEALIAELDRQGVLETIDDVGFEPMALARVAIKAADGDVVPLRGHRPR